MSTSIMDIAPFIPSDRALQKTSLADKAIELSMVSSKLAGQLSSHTVDTLEQHMRVINSYYSNLIEGNATRPHEIKAAQRGDYSSDAAKRDLQQESLAHMEVQGWLSEQSLEIDQIFDPAFILEIHKQFYQRIPENLWLIKDDTGQVVETVEPGQWRKRPVAIGQHLPPSSEALPSLMKRFCETYNPNNYHGDRKLIAIMCAHHRFSWLHPFLDGNGRIGRLITDAALKAVGLESYGVWCLSRGLAKSSSEYKARLANADSKRQGDLDGRGALTEKGLINFCDYMFDTAIDQANYISQLLNLSELRKRINSYVQARNDFRVSGVDGSLKPSSSLILYSAFIQGEISRSEALELCSMPERSARRVINQLKTDGLLSETSRKSPLRWEIPEHAEAWYFPDLAPL